ncbi:MAG TPA: N-acetyl-alpha-D-glucosaminyl L-malate synthase BshA [Candidatus Sumerlaeota bacterium]|nr:N-acetyl-alpha-D-glucosaminyl L-malate synthase BshA [Candidatus Sumerlaeota bacterium]
MKIGIVCSPTYGGSGVVATELGRFLAERGNEVHFISAAIPFRLQSVTSPNIFFHEVQSINYPVLPGEMHGITIASKTVQVAQDYDLDIVHAHYAIPHAISAWLAREVSPRQCKRFKVVTTLHGTDITLVGRAPSFFPIAQFAIENSDAVTTVSDWLRRETVKEFGIKRDIEVIPNFVDEAIFKRGLPGCKKHYYAPNNEKILMHISNFRPVKRVQDVIQVFARVQKEMPAKLILIGDGPERDGAAQLVRELHLMQHVYFLGKQDHTENFLSCSDVMLFPSEYESFGLAALEAMASENVVVTSNGGGIPELIKQGKNGFMANVGDVDEMARLTIGILRDDERRKEIGRFAREDAHERFHPEKIIPQYEALYDRVLGR